MYRIVGYWKIIGKKPYFYLILLYVYIDYLQPVKRMTVMFILFIPRRLLIQASRLYTFSLFRLPFAHSLLVRRYSRQSPLSIYNCYLLRLRIHIKIVKLFGFIINKNVLYINWKRKLKTKGENYKSL
jgi:hypothetical protein